MTGTGGDTELQELTKGISDATKKQENESPKTVKKAILNKINKKL